MPMKMPGKRRNAKMHVFCSGTPCELPTTEPSTYREVIEYYYHLTNVYESYHNRQKAKIIAMELIEVWNRIYSNMPIISKKAVENKVKKVLDTVKLINWKHVKSKQKDSLVDKLDQILDISACVCHLDEVPCGDRRILCQKSSCEETHLVCICPPKKNIPICARKYLKDQRNRNRNKDHYQMSTLQRIPPRKRLRRNKSPEMSQSAQADHRIDNSCQGKGLQRNASPEKSQNLEDDHHISDMSFKGTDEDEDNTPLCFMTLADAFLSRITRNLKNSLKNQKKLESGLGVEVFPVKGDRQIFMEDYLQQLYVSKKGVFSKQRSFGNRRPHLYVYDCEKSCFNKGKTCDSSPKARQQGCRAYVSFSFEEGATITVCILRYRLQHTGHSLIQPHISKAHQIDQTLKEQILEWAEDTSDIRQLLIKVGQTNKLNKRFDFKDRCFFPLYNDVEQLIRSSQKHLNQVDKEILQPQPPGQDDLADLLKTKYSNICLYCHPAIRTSTSYKPMILLLQSASQKQLFKQHGHSLLFVTKNFEGLRYYGSAAYALVVEDGVNQVHCVAFILTNMDDPAVLVQALHKFQTANKLQPANFLIDKDLVDCFDDLSALYPNTNILIPQYQVMQSVHHWLSTSAVGGREHKDVREVLLKYVLDLSRCSTEENFVLGIKELEEKVDYPEFNQMLKSRWLSCAPRWCEYGRIHHFETTANSTHAERRFLRLGHDFLKGIEYFTDTNELVAHIATLIQKGSISDDLPLKTEDLIDSEVSNRVIWTDPYELLIPEDAYDRYISTNLLTMHCECPQETYRGVCCHILLGKHLLAQQEIERGESHSEAISKLADIANANSDYVVDVTTCATFHNSTVCVTSLSDYSCTCSAFSLSQDCVGVVFLRKFGPPPSEMVKISEVLEDGNGDISDAETVTAVNSPSDCVDHNLGEDSIWTTPADSKTLQTKLEDITNTKDDPIFTEPAAPTDETIKDETEEFIKDSSHIEVVNPNPVETVADSDGTASNPVSDSPKVDVIPQKLVMESAQAEEPTKESGMVPDEKKIPTYPTEKRAAMLSPSPRKSKRVRIANHKYE